MGFSWLTRGESLQRARRVGQPGAVVGVLHEVPAQQHRQLRRRGDASLGRGRVAAPGTAAVLPLEGRQAFGDQLRNGAGGNQFRLQVGHHRLVHVQGVALLVRGQGVDPGIPCGASTRRRRSATSLAWLIEYHCCSTRCSPGWRHAAHRPRCGSSPACRARPPAGRRSTGRPCARRATACRRRRAPRSRRTSPPAAANDRRPGSAAGPSGPAPGDTG